VLPIDFSKAVGFVTDITKAAKRLSETREEVKVNEVAIQLQSIVLDLQSEMMMIQSNYQEVLRTSEDLKRQLVQHEHWEEEKERYELKFVGNATFVYALKASHELGQQKHWLCTNCYDHRQKSILQRIERGAPGMKCPNCNMDIRPTEWPMW
jgi:hypothetical protein